VENGEGRDTNGEVKRKNKPDEPDVAAVEVIGGTLP
jgi:hypothetical protein